MKKILIFSLILIAGSLVSGCASQNQITQSPPAKETRTAQVYFGNTAKNPNAVDCGAVFAVSRLVAKKEPLEAVLKKLFSGPTDSEKAKGYYSFFSSSTADILLSLKIVDSTAYLNFKDIRNSLANASASCGSQEFLAEIRRTIQKENPKITKIIYAINSDPNLFYEWLQLGCSAENNNCDDEPFY